MHSLPLLLCLAALHPAASAYTPIAQQAAGDNASPSWFDGLPTWHVTTSAVPASPAVPADAPARDCVFGEPLQFTLTGVNPASSFTLTATFLDDVTDGASREQSVAAGGVLLAPAFTLARYAIDTRVFNVTPASVTTLPSGQHALSFTITALRGPNAILSAFVLASSNPADPPLQPPSRPVPSQALPRLTPRALALPAAGGAPTSLDLMGTWQFDPAPSGQALAALRAGRPATSANWSAITVPGEYTLQGFRVPSGQPVVYQTAFTPPPAWGSPALRVKLRCDAVYSNATVYVNSVLVGSHLGGFTPFELDVSAALAGAAPGAASTLTLVVVGDSLADTLASGSRYASHDLGGISRKLYLLAVPALSIADAFVTTTFPTGNHTAAASLAVNISLANDAQGASAQAATVSAALTFQGVLVASGAVDFAAGGVSGGGGVAYAGLTLAVAAPALWDPEHPRLHNLTLTLSVGGEVVEVVCQRVGLRDVALAGNRVLVNGRPIKARGTTRHDAHPLVGRSLWTLEPAGGQWARDIVAFRDANVNYIRTSHYPPAEELMQAADELGMLIELEHPFCWASGNSGEAAFNYTVQAQREAMVFNRNHPSVIMCEWASGALGGGGGGGGPRVWPT